MTKPFLLFLLLTFYLKAVQAQKPLNITSVSYLTLKLPQAQTGPGFAPVAVMDKRFDTSKVGFCLDGAGHKMIRLTGGTANGVQQFLNDNNALGSSVSPAFLLVLRNLWMEEIKAGELKEADEENEKQNISRCIAKFDVFAIEDGYCRALVRIDTTGETPGYLKQSGAALLADVLNYTRAKIAMLNVKEATAKKTPVKMSELTRLYQQKMTLPRLTNDTVQRCVYLTYEDFVQKRPTPFNFVLEQDEGGDYLYLVEKGEQRLFTDFWGFCDGRFHFIKLGANFFPLVRDGDAFSFLGCLQPVHNSQPRSRNRVSRYALFGVLGELHQTRLVKFLRPMQLDMETGKPL